MRISQRLGLSFIVILSLLAIISTIALTQMNKQQQMAQAFVTDDVTQFVGISTIRSHAQRSALLLLQILPTQERAQRIALYKEMDDENRLLDAAISKMALSFDQNVPAQFSTLLARQKTYNEHFIETVEYVEADIETALEHYHESTRPSLEALLRSITNFLESEQMRMFKHQEANAHKSENVQTSVIIIAMIAFILGTLLALSVSRSIVGPLNDAVNLAINIAQGDLKACKINCRQDEVGTLVLAIEDMRVNLSNLISSIQSSSNHHPIASSNLRLR